MQSRHSIHKRAVRRNAPSPLATTSSAVGSARLAVAAGLACGGLISAASLVGESPARAGAAGFSCSISNGAPATMVQTSDGRNVPMIRWTSTAFDDAGWTPARRCQEVSQRFETFRQQGRLTYITTGRINGIPVVCTAPQTGAPCDGDGLLFTLKPGQDPTTTLNRLIDVRFKARGPMNESQGRLYINVDELLSSEAANTEPANTEAATPAPAPTPDAPQATAAAGGVQPLF